MSVGLVKSLVLFFAICEPTYISFYSLQCHFLTHDILLRTCYIVKISAIKLQNHKTEINIFDYKILRHGPPKLGTEIFMHKWGQITWKIPVRLYHRPQQHKPKYIEFLANFQMLIYKKIVRERPVPTGYALARFSHSWAFQQSVTVCWQHTKKCTKDTVPNNLQE